VIHPSAIIDPKARLGANVRIGPFACVGAEATLGDDVALSSHVVIDGPVTLGKGVTVGHHAVIVGDTTVGDQCAVFSFAALGNPPQHLKYKGEPARVEIGAHCIIREYVTVHRGTELGGGLTRVGEHSLIMAYCHVAHDCLVGNHVVMANGATLAGHVEIGDHVSIGGLTAIHQFARIGRNAFVGGCSAVSMDVVPFCTAAGNRTRVTGINLIGLQRKGFSDEEIRAIRTMHQLLFRSGMRLETALETIGQDFPGNEHAQTLITFIRNSQRGICRR
jgi:UDP-N-acetylglucosamine acyltransferase